MNKYVYNNIPNNYYNCLINNIPNDIKQYISSNTVDYDVLMNQENIRNLSIEDLELFLINNHKTQKIGITLNHNSESFNTFIKSNLDLNAKSIKLIFEYLSENQFHHEHINTTDIDNFFFFNYNIVDFIELYKNIINEIYKPIKNSKYLINVLKKKDNKLLDYLKFLKINKNDDKSIFDIYLEDFMRTPNSINNFYNFIFYLRKFNIFKILMNNYIKNVETNIYPYYREINEESGEYISIYPYYKNIPDSIKLLNTINLTSDNINHNNIVYYSTFFDELISIPRILRYYDENPDDINVRDIALKDIWFNITQFNNNEYIIYYILKINKIKKESVDEFLIFNIMLRYFFLFEYLELHNKGFDYNFKKFYLCNIDIINSEFETSNEMLYISDVKFYLIHIALAYKYFSKHVNYTSYQIYVKEKKAFLYFIEYLKKGDKQLKNLYYFLTFSTSKLKVIPEYKQPDNYLLDFLSDQYDILYKNTDKIIIN